MNPILIDLLIDPDTPAFILNCLILKEYGAACYNWEPETLWLQLTSDSGLKEIDEFVKEKISAVITLNTSSQFYDCWEPFEIICKTFNDQEAHFEDMTPLSSEECTWGLIEAALNDNDMGTFSGDVKAYIKTVFKADGVSTCPGFINPWVKYKSYNKYDDKQEQIKQLRIKSYCLLRINKIIDLSRKYFSIDVRKDLVKEMPGLSKYI